MVIILEYRLEIISWNVWNGKDLWIRRGEQDSLLVSGVELCKVVEALFKRGNKELFG